MRRVKVIAALGALLSVLGGVLTASPALAAGPGRSRGMSRIRRLLAAAGRGVGRAATVSGSDLRCSPGGLSCA